MGPRRQTEQGGEPKTPRRVPKPSRQPVEPNRELLLSIQRRAGNRAANAALADGTIQRTLAGSRDALVEKGGDASKTAWLKTVSTFGIGTSTYIKLLAKLKTYEKQEAKSGRARKPDAWFLTKLIDLRTLCSAWLAAHAEIDTADTEKADTDKADDADEGAAARAEAITSLREAVEREMATVRPPDLDVAELEDSSDVGGSDDAGPSLASRVPAFDIEEVIRYLEIAGDDAEGLRILYARGGGDLQARLRDVMTPVPGLRRLAELSYVLEAIDPRHRYGLTNVFHRWSEQWQDEMTTLMFFDFCAEQARNMRGQEMFTAMMSTSAPGRAAEVNYWNDEARRPFQIDIGATLTFTEGGAALTGENIFVVTRDGALYSGNKVRDSDVDAGERKVHHSSFLSGAPVMCAGNLWTSSSGGLTKVNLHSGHYSPEPAHLANFLTLLDKGGMDLSGVQVQPQIGREVLVSATDFLASRE